MDFDMFLQESAVPMHLIEDRLYLGGLAGARNAEILQANNITRIVECLEGVSPQQRFPFAEYHIVPVSDFPTRDIAQFIPGAIKFVHDSLSQGHSVLVHCAAGVSRSSSVVIAYFMAKYKIDFDEAKERVRAKRRCICPNMGFERQLRRFKREELESFLA